MVLATQAPYLQCASILVDTLLYSVLAHATLTLRKRSETMIIARSRQVTSRDFINT